MAEPTVWDLISKAKQLDAVGARSNYMESRGHWGKALEELLTKQYALQTEVEELAAKFKYVP